MLIKFFPKNLEGNHLPQDIVLVIDELFNGFCNATDEKK